MLIATFLVFGGIGLAMRPAQYSASVQGASTVKDSSAGLTDVSEKSRASVTKTEIETAEEEVPFPTTETYDGTLPKDTTVVKVEGRNGKKVVRTEVKTKDGEVTRSLISETITVPAVTKVVAIGTKVPPKPDKKRCEAPSNPACVSASTSDTSVCVDDNPSIALEACGNDPDADEQ